MKDYSNVPKTNI